MPEELVVLEGEAAADNVTRQLDGIREEFKKKRKELRRSQEAHGVVETIHGGFTFRLGNEVENFEKAFGFPD